MEITNKRWISESDIFSSRDYLSKVKNFRFLASAVFVACFKQDFSHELTPTNCCCCCQTVWTDLAHFRHFGNFLKYLDNFLKLLLTDGKNFNLLWRICYAIWHICMIINGQILKNNRAIWSHCCQITSFEN